MVREGLLSPNAKPAMPIANEKISPAVCISGLRFLTVAVGPKREVAARDTTITDGGFHES